MGAKLEKYWIGWLGCVFARYPHLYTACDQWIWLNNLLSLSTSITTEFEHVFQSGMLVMLPETRSQPGKSALPFVGPVEVALLNMFKEDLDTIQQWLCCTFQIQTIDSLWGSSNQSAIPFPPWEKSLITMWHRIDPLFVGNQWTKMIICFRVSQIMSLRTTFDSIPTRWAVIYRLTFVEEDEITLNDTEVVDLMTPPYYEMICQQSRCTEFADKGIWSHRVSSGVHLIY